MSKRLALALALWAGAATAEPHFKETGYLHLGTRPELHGLSGIELRPDGQTGWVITDYGHVAEVTLTRDANGQLQSFAFGPPHAVQRPRMDIPLMRRKDTEGLAWLPSGGFAISMEGPARIWHYDNLQDVPELLAPHFDLGILMEENGLEALAVDPEGRLITITEEKLRRADWMFPILRVDGSDWRWHANLRKQGPFLPVGADFGPDGELYILERAVSLLGFRSRIRRFDFATKESETLLQSHVGQYDNLEGIAIWQDAAGDLRATLVADDNFLRIQNGEIVEFRLVE